jgi:hypothetical protein
MLVVMPDEFSTKLDKFDFLAIKCADNLGPPMLMNERQFLSEIDFVHADSPARQNVQGDAKVRLIRLLDLQVAHF